MAAILGLADETVEALCRRILGVWPANYNCPGQIVVSGENDAVDACIEQAQSEGARRAVKLKVSGAFHSPLVARAADRLRPAIEKVKFQEPTSPFMSTVTARVESAQRIGPLLVDQLTAPVRFTQSATELMREGVRTFVEVGPGNVLSGLVKRIDRSVHAVSINNLEQLDRLPELLAESVSFASLDGKRALVTGASKGIGRAIAEELARGGAEVVVGYRTGADEAEELAKAIGGRAIQADVSSAEDAARLVEEAGDLDILVNNAGLTRDGLLARMSDDDWRTVIETNLSSVFYTCRAVDAADDEEARRRDRQRLLDRRRPRQLGPDELRGVEGRDHRLHEVARPRARQPQRPRERRRARLRQDAAHRRPARRRRPPRCSRTRRSAGSASRATSRGRYASSAPTRQRSSRGMCCSSTADSGCSGQRERLHNGRRRVVVTGLGAVTPLGLDVESTWSALLAGESGAGPITQFDHTDYKVHFACEVKDLDPTDWMDRKDARRVDRFTHLIVAAARQAETDSGLDIAKEADRIGASIATGIGGLKSFQECYDTLIDEGPDRVNPFAIPSIIPNLGAGWVSIELGTRGPLMSRVHGVRRVEHGDRRRDGRDPARPRRRDDRRRHRGGRERGRHRRLRRDARALARATTIRSAPRGRSTPSATAS